ncbi:MAG: uroporphyrinogen decarboxylase family protein [Bacteroidetes bacterium]|nr:uroporphyrinogen decarboxylase family protein [Bacteroidota bacterium]
MNGYERIMAAFSGRQPDTVPVMLHNFMMAAREAGVTMEQFRNDPKEMARSFIEAVEKYGHDGVLVDVDTVTLAGAAGVPIDFPLEEPARVRGSKLQSLEEVQDLAPVDISTYHGVQVWLEATILLKEHFGDEILIRGNCDQCPFTLAGMVRGMSDWMLELIEADQEENVRRLLEWSTDITLQLITLMSGTGAHIVSNGDSGAGPELVSPAIYRTFALPYERTIVEESHARGLPYILHICGKTEPILDEMIASGADGLELDYKTNPAVAHQKMRHRAVFIGNIDPSGVLARGTPEMVEQKTLELLKVFADTPRFILNAGCAIPPITPPENVKVMISTARQFQG